MDIKDCRTGDILVLPGINTYTFAKVVSVGNNTVKLINLRTVSHQDLATPYITMLRVEPTDETYGKVYQKKNLGGFRRFSKDAIYREVLY